MWRAMRRDPRARLNLGIRRRLAPLLGGDRARLELMNGLLFSLPGTPVVYYGDEIGMGDNLDLPDRYGVRTPMQWDAGPNAGFSTAPSSSCACRSSAMAQYRYQAVNVAAQRADPGSLLCWMKRSSRCARTTRASGVARCGSWSPRKPAVLAYLREHDGEDLLVVANLSPQPLQTALPLGDHAGSALVDLLTATGLPPVGTDLYPLHLAGHGFRWLRLEDGPA